MESAPLSTPEPDTVATRGDRSTELNVFHEAGWYGGEVRFSDPAMDKIARKALSPSTAKSVRKECMARWAIERMLPRVEDPFDAAPLGTSVHTVFEDLFALPGYARTQSEAARIVHEHAMAQWPGSHASILANRTRWIGEVMKRVEPLWQMEDPSEVVIHALELDLSGVSIGGVPFVGYADRVDVEADGKLRVVDYKTGKLDESKLKRYGDDPADQMRLYYLALEAKGHEVGSAHAYFTGAGKARRAATSRPYLNATRKEFVEAWDNLRRMQDAAAFPTKPGPLCGYCPLVKMCPSAKLAGWDEDKTGGALPVDDPKLVLPVVEDFTEAESDALLCSPAARKSVRREPAAQTSGPVASYGSGPTDDDFGSASSDAFFTPPVEPAPDHQIDPIDTGFALPESTPVSLVGVEAESPVPEITQEYLMNTSTTAPMIGEDKPWITTTDGALNGNSYAAIGLFGITSMAYEFLAKAGVPITPVTIRSLTATLSGIVATVQASYSGSTNRDAGLNTRLRGLLRTFIEVNPMPFGGDHETWAAWANLAVSHVGSMTRVAIDEFGRDPHPAASQEAPFAGLVGVAPQR